MSFILNAIFEVSKCHCNHKIEAKLVNISVIDKQKMIKIITSLMANLNASLKIPKINTSYRVSHDELLQSGKLVFNLK